MLARNVNNDAEPPVLAGLGQKFGSDKFGYGFGEVDAVDKDVN